MPEAAPAAAQATAPAATNGAATTDATATSPPAHEFEVKVGGELRKYTRAEAERLLSRVGQSEKDAKQYKEALKAAAEKDRQREEEEAAWSDEAKWEEMLSKKKVDLDKLARKRLEAKIAEREMTPEQKAKAEAEAKADRLQKELDERTKKEAEEKKAQVAKQLQARMEQQLADAAEKAGLPKDADSFYAVYEAVREWQRLKLPWDPERIIETAKENIEGGFKRLEESVLKGLKGKALHDRLGAHIVDEIIRYRIELARGTATRPPTPGTTTQTRPPAKQETLSPQEYMARARGER